MYVPGLLLCLHRASHLHSICCRYAHCLPDPAKMTDAMADLMATHVASFFCVPTPRMRTGIRASGCLLVPVLRTQTRRVHPLKDLRGDLCSNCPAACCAAVIAAIGNPTQTSFGFTAVETHFSQNLNVTLRRISWLLSSDKRPMSYRPDRCLSTRARYVLDNTVGDSRPNHPVWLHPCCARVRMHTLRLDRHKHTRNNHKTRHNTQPKRFTFAQAHLLAGGTSAGARVVASPSLLQKRTFFRGRDW